MIFNGWINEAFPSQVANLLTWESDNEDDVGYGSDVKSDLEDENDEEYF